MQIQVMHLSISVLTTYWIQSTCNLIMLFTLLKYHDVHVQIVTTAFQHAIIWKGYIVQL